MDRNKSVFKLEGFGPIYCINLDEQPERWEYMKKQYDYWGLDNVERISAYDGREDDLSDIIQGRYPEAVSSTALLFSLYLWRQHIYLLLHNVWFYPG
jgi:GR25 family glycosyltransferase involved in LPS biosynthesis